jgi:hypothetical protein
MMHVSVKRVTNIPETGVPHFPVTAPALPMHNIRQEKKRG